MSDEITELRQHWYEILKESGFVDIENTTHPNLPIKDWHSQRFKKVNVERKNHIENYYKKACELLLTHTFQSELHKKIWQLHSEGKSIRKIEREISTSENPMKRDAIFIFISKLRNQI